MPELMIFKSVIDEQGVPFIAHLSSDGDYVDGEWVEGIAAPVELTGIILPLVAGSKSVGEALSYMENGKYTNKEKKLLTTTLLPNGTLAEYRGEKYTIQAFTDYTEYTDVNIYIMRWRKK
ncbi:hypothetical protein [Lysinibacillus fusiformis]|uniref:hypothetical protein n=1 Tax=Lysinibacillus fusiformis TaxID=28031 RepID=UPI003558512F